MWDKYFKKYFTNKFRAYCVLFLVILIPIILLRQSSPLCSLSWFLLVGPDIFFVGAIFLGFYYYYFKKLPSNDKVVLFFFYLLCIIGIYSCWLIFSFYKIDITDVVYAGNSVLLYTVTDIPLKLFICLFYFLTIVLWFGDVLRGVCKQLELAFFISILFYCFQISIHCSNFFYLFLLMELITLLIVICIITYSLFITAHTIKAVLQFFILNVFISSFYLFGVSLLLFFLIPQAGYSLHYANILLTIDFFLHFFGVSQALFSFIKLIMIFWLCTFFFKLTLAPFSIWINTIYTQLPVIFLIVLMTIYKFIYILLFLKVFVCILGFWTVINDFIIFSSLMVIIPSLFIGCLAYRERDLKTIFAYTTVSQLGFVISGCLVQSLAALEAAILYIIMYCLQLAAVFIILILLQTKYTVTNSNQLFMILKYNSFYCYSLVFIFFSFAGVPPLSGFFLKYFLLLHIYNAGFFSLALAGLVAGFAMSIIYFQLIIQLLRSKPQSEVLVEAAKTMFFIKQPRIFYLLYTRILNIFILIVLILTVGFYFFYFSSFFSYLIFSITARLFFFY